MALKKTAVIELLLKDRNSLTVTKDLRKEFQQLNATTEFFEKNAGSALSFVGTKGAAAAKNLGNSFGKGKQNIAGTGAAVTNLSRIIQDAPFGVIGVANNIEPFITSFQRMGDGALTSGQKIKQLISSAFTGGGGLITIVSLVTSAATAISMGIFSMGDASDETDEKLESLKEKLDEFIELSGQLRGEAVFDPLGQVNLQQQIASASELKAELDSLFNLRDQAKALREELGRVSQATAFGTNIVRFSGGDVRSELDATTESLREQERIFGELTAAQEEDIAAKLEELAATEKLNAAFIRMNPALEHQLSLNERLQPVLRDAELGLTGSREALEAYITSTEQSIEHLREQINSGELQGKQLETSKQLLDNYVSSLKQANSAYEGLTKAEREQAASSAQAAEALRQARQEINDAAAAKAQEEDTIFDADLPSADDLGKGMDLDLGAPIGSIQLMRDKLQGLKEDFRLAADDDSRAKIASEIDTVEGKIKSMTGATNEGLSQNAQAMGQAAAQAIMYSDTVGEAAQNVVKALINEIVTRAILAAFNPPTPASLVLAPIFAATAQKLISSLIGFRSGVDDFGGGMARVHKDEMIVGLPEGSSVLTNRNVRRMDRMQREAGQGAAALSGVNSAAMAAAIKQGVIEGMQQVELNPQVDLQLLNQKLNKLNKYKSRIGN